MEKNSKRVKPLPRYVREKSGRYYFEPKGALLDFLGFKSKPLGASYNDMLVMHASLMAGVREGKELGIGCSLVSVFFKKFMEVRRKAMISGEGVAESTYKGEVKKSKKLLEFFGGYRLEQITTQDVYRYITVREGDGAKQVQYREISLLSVMINYAIQTGMPITNPCINIKRKPPNASTRVVTDEEYLAFRSFVRDLSPLIYHYLEFKVITGLRMSDILGVRDFQLLDDGVLVDISKTSKKVMFEWTPDLIEAVRGLKEVRHGRARGRVIGPKTTLICNRKFKPYTPDGWRTNFYRLMRRAVDEGVLAERFNDTDLRSKAARDCGDLNQACRLLAHSSPKVTAKHYMRGKPEFVRPVR